MGDFLKFKKMVTPIIIQVAFWFAIVICLVGGVIGLSESPVKSILMIVLGPLVVRVYCEVLIVIFKIKDTLVETQNLLKESLYSEAE